ncbi:uncharacterized protein LOC114273729 isoform X1 [Camellia sinensis]|uniref:uncharacterized protein LOC114273729 isoform X1 n=1 Tax=Camellia sinensis TaxID=4442 RepID=UPI001035570A|nr:uncharacterized protein LOC114273729 isoform X1 [Camellia sinensis]
MWRVQSKKQWLGGGSRHCFVRELMISTMEEDSLVGSWRLYWVSVLRLVLCDTWNAAIQRKKGIDCRCERINQEREVKLLSMILFPLNISSSFSNCNHYIPNEYNSRKFLYQLCTYASVFVF